MLRTCLESHAEANPQNFRRQPEAGPPRAEKPYAWPEPISAILPPATSTVRPKAEEQRRRRARCGTVSLKRQRHWGERAGPFGLRPARRIAALSPRSRGTTTASSSRLALRRAGRQRGLEGLPKWVPESYRDTIDSTFGKRRGESCRVSETRAVSGLQPKFGGLGRQALVFLGFGR